MKRKEDVKLLGYKEGIPVVVEFTEFGRASYGTRARGQFNRWKS